jgi:hypothetical protein
MRVKTRNFWVENRTKNKMRFLPTQIHTILPIFNHNNNNKKKKIEKIKNANPCPLYKILIVSCKIREFPQNISNRETFWAGNRCHKNTKRDFERSSQVRATWGLRLKNPARLASPPSARACGGGEEG